MGKFFSFKTLVSVSALTIASCAALFSVTGIGTLFAGAATSVMVMAGAFELGKLVSISFLYRYWSDIPRTLKSYMVSASLVLVVITSAGIYGYLSSAYAKVAVIPLKLNAEIGIIKSQAQTLEEEINRRNDRLTRVIAIRQQQENRVDNLIAKSTTGLSTSIRSAQIQVNELNKSEKELQKEVSSLLAKRDSLQIKSVTTEVEVNTNSDIGTFVYIAKAIGVPLDTVVKWFILIIVMVFDPLSICLVLTYNFLVKREPIPVFNQERGSEPITDTTTRSIDRKLTLEEIEELKKIPFNGEWDANDPFPQYMTKSETEEVLETWWARRNGLYK